MTTTQATATQTPRKELNALVSATPLRTLANALLILDTRGSLDDAEQLTRATIIDTLCEHCPAADAAFNAWAESDDFDVPSPAPAIYAAVMAA
jgi:hypothetical protein